MNYANGTNARSRAAVAAISAPATGPKYPSGDAAYVGAGGSERGREDRSSESYGGATEAAAEPPLDLEINGAVCARDPPPLLLPPPQPPSSSPGKRPYGDIPRDWSAEKMALRPAILALINSGKCSPTGESPRAVDKKGLGC
jgi:hypothetical protein